MPEDEMIFNPIMTNNEMEKPCEPFNDMEKKPLTLDEEEGDKGTIGGEESREKMEASKEMEREGVGEDKELDLDDLNIFNQMKKKKKPKVFDSELEEGIKDLKITEDEQTMEAMEEDGVDLLFPAKKKRSKKVHFEEGEMQENYNALEGDKPPERLERGSKGLALAADSERDYTYEELLDRLYSNMREKNPAMVAGEMKRFLLKPPHVVRVGTKKTSFVNFIDICSLLHRQPEHLLAFLLAELGTSGSIDGNNQLLIKGRFQAVQIENILRRYIKEYVRCHTCRSPKTILQKDTRLYFLQCETCHSRCSVTSIRTGFQALTGKRAQIRAKAN